VPPFIRLRSVQVSIPAIPHHLFVAASAWASRAVMALVQFASIRVLMTGLGLEQYAVFALLTGLAGWFMLADFGIGASLQNYISEHRAKTLGNEAYVISAAVLAAFFLVFNIVALYASSPYIAPILLKQFPALTNSDKENLFFLAGCMFVVSALGGLSYKIWYAEQKGYLSNMLPTIASLLGYFGIVVVNKIASSNQLLLCLIAFIAPVAILPFAALVAQIGTRIGIGFRQLNWTIFAKVLKRASPFWIFALMSNLVLQIDYLVISQLLKPDDIVAYNLSTKIFGLAFFIYASLLTSLWPAFSEAIARGNWATVKGHTRKYLWVGLGFMSIATIFLAWTMPAAIHLLAPSETILIPIVFVILLGAYQLIRVWTDTFAMILMSMSDIRPLWLTSPIQALLSISLQWYLAQSYGIYGIVFGLMLSFLLTASWTLPWAVHKHYSKIANRSITG